MGAVYAGLLLERSDAFCATTPHHQIVRTVCQITSSLGHVRICSHLLTLQAVAMKRFCSSTLAKPR